MKIPYFMASIQWIWYFNTIFKNMQVNSQYLDLVCLAKANKFVLFCFFVLFFFLLLVFFFLFFAFLLFCFCFFDCSVLFLFLCVCLFVCFFFLQVVICYNIQGVSERTVFRKKFTLIPAFLKFAYYGIIKIT